MHLFDGAFVNGCQLYLYINLYPGPGGGGEYKGSFGILTDKELSLSKSQGHDDTMVIIQYSS